VRLLREIRTAQQHLAQSEVGAISETSGETSQELSRFIESLATAWRDGETRPTHRKPNTGPRPWRTRADPFENAWTVVKEWLNEHPDANAKGIFVRLQAHMPDTFTPGQLRTLQRRVRQWRAEVARKLVLGCQGTATETATSSDKEVVTL
jgi:hypothetical protein